MRNRFAGSARIGLLGAAFLVLILTAGSARDYELAAKGLVTGGRATQAEKARPPAERIIRVATFRCPLPTVGPASPEVARGIVEALSEGRPPRPNPHMGRWQCEGPPDHGWQCQAVPGTPLGLNARRVRLEFAVEGNCATFSFPGRTPIQAGPGRVAVRLGQSQRLRWRITLAPTGAPSDPLIEHVWHNSFNVRLGPAVSPR